MAACSLHRRMDRRRTSPLTTSTWRPLLIIAGALFAQLAPAGVCAAFDGPGKQGCPVAFLSLSTLHSSGDPDGKTGNCSWGPSYLSLEGELRLAAPHAMFLGDTLPIGLVLQRAVAIEWRTEVVGCFAARLHQSDHDRHLYLSTHRLRL